MITNVEPKILSRSSALQPRSLIVAAARGEIGTIENHLSHGGHPDATVPGKPTALGYAAMFNFTDLAWVLIRAGALTDYQDTVGNTPLIYSALSGSPEVMDLLLNNGTDSSLVNRAGHTMRYYIKCGTKNTSKMLLIANTHRISTGLHSGNNYHFIIH